MLDARAHGLTLLYLLAILALIFAADHGTLAVPPAVAAVPAADKAGHFLLFGLLSYLLNVSLGARRLRLGRVRVLAGSLALAVAVTVEELSQIWIANRSFDLADLLADVAGVLAFGHLAARSVARTAYPADVSPDSNSSAKTARSSCCAAEPTSTDGERS